jgi:hypothetical protein
VDDLQAVRRLQGGREVGDDVEGRLLPDAPAAAQVFLQGEARHVLHHQVQHPELLAEIEHAHDAVVGDAGRQLGLAAEAVPEGGVLRAAPGELVGAEHLDGHGDAQGLVDALVHRGHGALAQQGLQVAFADHLADEDGHAAPGAGTPDRAWLSREEDRLRSWSQW